MLEIIKNIEEVYDYKIQPIATMNGLGGRLGMAQMMSLLCGYSIMDGYKVETEEHTY